MRIAGIELRDARPVAGGDICAAYRAVLDDGTAVFAKTHRAPPDGFFTAEATGLDLLRDVDGPPVPEVEVAGVEQEHRRRQAQVGALLAHAQRAESAKLEQHPPLTNVSLPAAGIPNLPGTIAFPANWTLPPAQPQQLDYAQLQGIWQRAGTTYG